MKEIRFFIKNILLCSLPFVMFNVIIALLLIVTSNTDDLTYVSYASSLDKRSRLDSLSNQKRIVIIGGSNARFAFQSGLIKEELGIEPVNMGLHIALGLNYMLEEVEHKLKSEDILLISPEYQHFMSNDIYGGTSDLTDMYLVQKNWGKAFEHMIETKNFVSFYKLLRKRYKRRKINTDSIPETMEVRTKYNFYGDYVGHYKLPAQKLQRCDVSSKPNSKIVADVAKRINILKEAGVKVYILPPPFSETAYKRDLKNIEAIQTALQRAGIGFAVPPIQSVYPDSMFYDTEYHLNKKGGTQHTLKMAYIISHQLR